MLSYRYKLEHHFKCTQANSTFVFNLQFSCLLFSGLSCLNEYIPTVSNSKTQNHSICTNRIHLFLSCASPYSLLHLCLLFYQLPRLRHPFTVQIPLSSSDTEPQVGLYLSTQNSQSSTSCCSAGHPFQPGHGQEIVSPQWQGLF